MADDDDDEQFYDAKSPASQTKITIVTKYFAAWAKILGPISVRLAYMDLYCGPGRYKKGGEPSTPMLIVEHIIADPKLREKVETHFNDEEPEYTASLKANLEALPGYATLRFSLSSLQAQWIVASKKGSRRSGAFRLSRSWTRLATKESR